VRIRVICGKKFWIEFEVNIGGWNTKADHENTKVRKHEGRIELNRTQSKSRELGRTASNSNTAEK
jgi:hypothetical protein